MNEKHNYTFLCSDSKCLCQTKLSITYAQYVNRFYFGVKLNCPICGQMSYRVIED